MKKTEIALNKKELLENIFTYFNRILLDSAHNVFRIMKYREIEDSYIDDITIKKRWFSEDKVIITKKFVPGYFVFSYNTTKNINSNIISTYTCYDLKELKIFEELLITSYVRIEGIKNDLAIFKVFIAD